MLRQALSNLRRLRYQSDGRKISEMQILYMAKMLRFFALNLSGGFVLMHIYELGYGWAGVILALILIWSVRTISVFLGGIYVAKNGPKHGILLSNLLSIPLLILVGLAKEFGLWAVVLAMILQGATLAIYNLAYFIDFSRVKKGENASKQIGWMSVIEKASGVVAPIVGSWLAVSFGAQSAMFVSAAIYAASAVPLLATREISKDNFKIDLKSFPYKKHKRNFIAHFWAGAYGVYAAIWGVFVPVFIFSNENSYGVIGFLASLSSAFSIIISIILGKSISEKSGKMVLQGSIVGYTLSILVAGALVFTKSAAILVNLFFEMFGVGYKISGMKGFFSDADMSKRRIEYFMIYEGTYILGSIFFASLAGILALIFGAEAGLRYFMVVSGVLALGSLVFKYPIYEKQK